MAVWDEALNNVPFKVEWESGRITSNSTWPALGYQAFAEICPFKEMWLMWQVCQLQKWVHAWGRKGSPMAKRNDLWGRWKSTGLGRLDSWQELLSSRFREEDITGRAWLVLKRRHSCRNGEGGTYLAALIEAPSQHQKEGMGWKAADSFLVGLLVCPLILCPFQIAMGPRDCHRHQGHKDW